MPNIRWLLTLITATHRFVYLKTNGRIGAKTRSMRFLLLTHVGRRTGLPRVTPLLCLVDDDRWIVAGSNNGDDRPPAWWLNLKSCPEAHVQYATERVAVKMREATGEEYQEMWSRLQASYPYFDNYRQRTARRIPVVILDRTERV